VTSSNPAGKTKDEKYGKREKEHEVEGVSRKGKKN
jgi:hypothetical protein